VFGGIVLLLVLLLVVTVLAAMTVALALAFRTRADSTLTSEVASARRHATTTSGLSVTAMLGAPAVAVLLLGVGGVLGLRFLSVSIDPVLRLMACLPLLGTLLGLLVLLVGELTWPRPTGASRTALLHDRSARSLLTRGWPLWGASVTALGAVLLVLGGIAADGTGASVTRYRPDGQDTAGPFPGWTYAGPQLVVLALCVGAAALCVLAVARRSAVLTADVETDQLLRRASVARVSRALVAGVLVTLGPDLLLGGNAVHGAFRGTTAGSFGGVLALLGALALVLGFAALAVPVPRLPAVPSYAPPGPSVTA
jgi:hypothetical protein